MAFLTKLSILKSVRSSAKCYDKHFVFLDVFTSNEQRFIWLKVIVSKGILIESIRLKEYNKNDS